MSFMEFLNNLLERNMLMPFLLFASFLAIAVIVGIVFILKVALKYFSKKKIGVKLGDKEFNYDGSESDEGLENLTKTPITNVEKLASTISTVINYGIETGYDNCRVRQSLYDSQVKIIKNNFELIVTNILNDYLANNGQNYEVAKVLVNHAIEKEVIQKLKDICKADRMAEKTKERVVEHDRSFIESAYPRVKQELVRLANSVQKTRDSANFSYTYQDDILLKSLENQETALKRMITTSLEEAYDDAVKYLEEVHDNNQALHNKVNNVMKSYLESSEHEKLPKEWLMDQNITPPNQVVGE